MAFWERLPIISRWIEDFKVRMREGIRESVETPLYLRTGLGRGTLSDIAQRAIAENEVLRERLKKVYRVLDPLRVDPLSFKPEPKQMVAVTVSVLLPNGKVETYHIGMGFGKVFNEADFRRRLSSAIMQRFEDSGGKQGMMDRTLSRKVDAQIIAKEYYVEEYHAI